MNPSSGDSLPDGSLSHSKASSELEHTIKMGNQVGFHFINHDPTLLEAVNGGGVKITS